MDQNSNSEEKLRFLDLQNENNTIFQAVISTILNKAQSERAIPNQEYLNLIQKDHAATGTHITEDITQASFIVDAKTGKANKVETIAKFKSANHEEQNLSNVELGQKERTQFMRTQGLLTSSINNDIILYAPHANSGVTKGQTLNNVYLALHYNGQKWSSIVGAAQGAELKKQKNISDNPSEETPLLASKPTPKTKEDIIEAYKQEAIYEAALGVVGQFITAKMNGETPEIAKMVVLSNYISDSLGVESDPKMVAARREAAASLEKNGIPIAVLKQALAAIHPEAAQEIEGLLSKEQKPLSVIFNQNGINLDRHFSGSTDDHAYCAKIREQFSEKLKNDSETRKMLNYLDRHAKAKLGFPSLVQWTRALWKPIADLITPFLPQLPTLPAPLQKIANGIGFTLNLPLALPHLGLRILRTLPTFLGLDLGNKELHKEAIKLLVQDRLGIISLEGCKSAKDRAGMVRLLAQTYQDYMHQHGKMPPAIGSISYYLLSQDKKDSLKAAFINNYFSGSAQFVAHANAENASGIKNTSWLLGREMRNMIHKECNQRIETLKETQKQYSPESEGYKEIQGQIERINLLRPGNTEKVAEGNKDYKKMDKKNADQTESVKGYSQSNPILGKKSIADQINPKPFAPDSLSLTSKSSAGLEEKQPTEQNKLKTH